MANFPGSPIMAKAYVAPDTGNGGCWPLTAKILPKGSGAQNQWDAMVQEPGPSELIWDSLERPS